VKLWQREHGLEMDGVLGPITRASIANNNTRISAVIYAALADVGKGEQGGNNAGYYVRGLRKFCGFPEELLGPWCSIWVSAMIKQAKPFSQALDFRLSRSAYGIVTNIGNSPGGRFMDLDAPEPGFACWYRRNGKGQIVGGHVRIITDYDPETDTMGYVAGNERGRVVLGSLTGQQWRHDLRLMSTFV
jgi:hypothetical protein